MRLAVDVPNFGDYANPRMFLDLARATEQAGWDGLFVWDHMLVWDGNVVADPWVLLAAAATATERIRLGPMVTPLPRRRPWKVAREAVTLDHLSGGRLILGVGIGFPPEPEFAAFGEPASAAVRAELLDESLDILEGLWSGEPFRYEGRHFKLDEMTFMPVPLQRPRIPIWVAGMWPNQRPFRRAARYDGVFPIVKVGDEMPMIEPPQLTEVVSYVGAHRADDSPYDVAVEVDLPADLAEAAETVARFAEAGATWMNVGPGDYGRETSDAFLARVRRGPPRS